jgi:hypothetical protein
MSKKRMKRLRKVLGLHNSFEVQEDPYFLYEKSSHFGSDGVRLSASRRIDHPSGINSSSNSDKSDQDAKDKLKYTKY